METLYLQVQLSSAAAKSFLNELKNNNIQYRSITTTSFLVQDTPKSRMAVKLTKERFGSTKVYTTIFS